MHRRRAAAPREEFSGVGRRDAIKLESPSLENGKPILSSTKETLNYGTVTKTVVYVCAQTASITSVGGEDLYVDANYMIITRRNFDESEE